MEAATNKTCSFCGEEILAVAIKCKHCQSALDGSSQAVNVKNVDPFAEYHTPIKGKSKGNITFVGYLGMLVVGPLATFAGCSIAQESGKGQQGMMMSLFGIGAGIGCYLWARR